MGDAKTAPPGWSPRQAWRQRAGNRCTLRRIRAARPGHLFIARAAASELAWWRMLTSPEPHRSRQVSQVSGPPAGPPDRPVLGPSRISPYSSSLDGSRAQHLANNGSSILLRAPNTISSKMACFAPISDEASLAPFTAIASVPPPPR